MPRFIIILLGLAVFASAACAAEINPELTLYPQGKLFLYAGYSGNVERDLRHGFTVAGPFYGHSQDKEIAYCYANNLPIIVHLGFAEAGWGNLKTLEKAATLTAAAVQDLVKAQLKKYDLPNNNIVMWGIVPEEVRPWKAGELNYLKIVAATIRANDPRQRPLYMYHPNNRTTELLNKMSPHLDYLGRGMYANVMGYTHDRAWIRWGVEQCVKACVTPRHVPLANLWMAIDPQNPADDALIPVWVRHDVYLSLVAGAKGIIVWSLHDRRKGFERTWENYYAAYAQCGRELTGEKKIADIFLFGEKVNTIKVKPQEKREPYIFAPSTPPTTENATTTPKEKVAGVTLQPFSVAEFTLPNKLNEKLPPTRYLFIVNSTNQPTTFKINIPTTQHAKRIYDVFTDEPISERQITDAPLTAKLSAWAVLGWRIETILDVF